jgi:hypothetical protein
MGKDDRIIFTKYSTERAPFLQIRTDIVQTKDGIKYIYKMPINHMAESHISNLYRIYSKLCKLYNNKDILINQCVDEYGKIRFDFVEGISLEEKLDIHLASKDYEAIMNLIKEFQDLFILNINDIKIFQKTEDFVAIFGDVTFSKELTCLSISNIDLIFSNIIINNQWNVIDYEWTFDFPIPSNFILYRALCNYLYFSDKRADLYQFNLFQHFGIDEDEMIQYRKMDQNFHQYVLKGYTPLNVLYSGFNRTNYLIQDIIKDIENLKTHIFYDYGDGFSETNSEYLNCRNEDGEFELSIPINQDIKMLRIDPSERNCIFYLSEVWLDDEEVSEYGRDTRFWINGEQLSEKLYLFVTEDPQLVIPEAQKIHRLRIKYTINIIDKNYAISLSNFIKQQNNVITDSRIALNTAQEEKEMMIQEFNNEKELLLQEFDKEKDLMIQECNKEKELLIIKYSEEKEILNNKWQEYVERLESSTSWRITKPMRDLKKLFNQMTGKKENTNER